MKKDTPPDQQFLFPFGDTIELAKINTDSCRGFENDEEAQESIRRDTELLVKHQDMLMAHETYGLLILFQGMDASGKD